MRRPSISITVRSSPLSWREESLYGLRMGTTCSTPGAPSRPRRATCSRSPTAPITVTSSPREGWARAPQDSIRSMTAWISSSVAVDFITIIMGFWAPGSSRLRQRYGLRWDGARPEGPRMRTASPRRGGPAERLAKSPGAVGEGVGAAEAGGGAGLCGSVGHRGALARVVPARDAGSQAGSRVRAGRPAPPGSGRCACRVPTVTRSAPGRPSAVPERTSTPRSARPLTISRSSHVSVSGSSSPRGRSNQRKLACDSAGAIPSPRRPSSRPSRSARFHSTRRATSSWWRSASVAAACAAALQKNGWRTWSTAMRNSSAPHSAKPTRSPHRP